MNNEKGEETDKKRGTYRKRRRKGRKDMVKDIINKMVPRKSKTMERQQEKAVRKGNKGKLTKGILAKVIIR